MDTFDDLHNFLGTKPAADSANGRDELDFVSASFPEIFKLHGAALEMGRDGMHVKRISEDFFAQLLGLMGQPERPVVFIPEEDCFYQYLPDLGMFSGVSNQSLHAQLAKRIREISEGAKLPKGVLDSFRIRFGKTAELKGVVERAKALLAQRGFFSAAATLVATVDGVLDLVTEEFSTFSPKFQIRNKLTVRFEPGATCPIFIDRLLRPMMTADDLKMLQLWCGMALSGRNAAQVILQMIGDAGSGKGVFLRILHSILGETNVTTLRTTQLGGRFEMSRFMGKSLLVGSDVPPDFLDNKSAPILKSLTGGDPIDCELKCSHEVPRMSGIFNVLIIANAMLRVRLDQDAEAWRRRFLIIPVTKPTDRAPQHDLADQIIAQEGPGILNWMVEGLRQLRAAGFRFTLTETQQSIIDQVLGSSDSVRHFVDKFITASEHESLSVSDAFDSYRHFCRQQRWQAVPMPTFSREMSDLMTARFGVAAGRHVLSARGTEVRGWDGLLNSYKLPPSGGVLRLPGSGIPDGQDGVFYTHYTWKKKGSMENKHIPFELRPQGHDPARPSRPTVEKSARSHHHDRMQIHDFPGVYSHLPKLDGTILQAAANILALFGGPLAIHDGRPNSECPPIIVAENSTELPFAFWEILIRRALAISGYAFNKAHSTAYGESKRIKGVLTNGKGFYHPVVDVLECHRLGFGFLAPSVNEPGPCWCHMGNRFACLRATSKAVPANCVSDAPRPQRKAVSLHA